MNLVNIINQLLASIKVNYLNNNKYAYCRHNRLLLNVLYILYKEGLIVDYMLDGSKTRITLKYYDNKPLIKNFKNYSKPSLQHFIKANNIAKLSKEYDYYALTTSKGIILVTHRSLEYKIGGRLLFGIKLNI